MRVAVVDLDTAPKGERRISLLDSLGRGSKPKTHSCKSVQCSSGQLPEAAQSAQTKRRIPSSNSIGTGSCFSRTAGALSTAVGVAAGGGGDTASTF